MREKLARKARVACMRMKQKMDGARSGEASGVRIGVCVKSNRRADETRPVYVLKGRVACNGAGQDTKIHALSADGTVIATASAGRAAMPRPDEGTTEAPFTLRIPAWQDAGYLAVQHGGAPLRVVRALTEDDLERLVDESALTLFRIAHPGPYGRFTAGRDGAEADAVGKAAGLDGAAGPLFSIVVPLYNTPAVFFREMLASVTGQTYGRWELVLVNASPGNQELGSCLSAIEDERVVVVELEENLGIAGNTNAGIRAASGDYICLFDHDDLLAPMVLQEYAQALAEDPSIDVLYCDEDLQSEDGAYVGPHFKSDFNLDLLRCHNYVTHLLAVRAPLMRELMLDSEFDGAQDYDLVLRLAERTHAFRHIPRILYHWRMHDGSTAKNAGNKADADERGRMALERHLARCGLEGTVGLTDIACFYHAGYEMQGEPLVSIIIPSCGDEAAVRATLESVGKTDYARTEIIVVGHGRDLAALEEEGMAGREEPRVRVVPDPSPGDSFAAACNRGAREAAGEYLVFLEPGVLAGDGAWLQPLIADCQRGDVGAAGPKVLFDDGTVMSAGMFAAPADGLSGKMVFRHAFAHADRADHGYMQRASLRQDVSAVSHACLMTRSSAFADLGGFREDCEAEEAAIGYCLRLQDAGYLVVFEPDSIMYAPCDQGAHGGADAPQACVPAPEGAFGGGDPYLTRYAMMPDGAREDRL